MGGGLLSQMACLCPDKSVTRVSFEAAWHRAAWMMHALCFPISLSKTNRSRIWKFVSLWKAGVDGEEETLLLPFSRQPSLWDDPDTFTFLWDICTKKRHENVIPPLGYHLGTGEQVNALKQSSLLCCYNCFNWFFFPSQVLFAIKSHQLACQELFSSVA